MAREFSEGKIPAHRHLLRLGPDLERGKNFNLGPGIVIGFGNKELQHHSTSHREDWLTDFV